MRSDLARSEPIDLVAHRRGPDAYVVMPEPEPKPTWDEGFEADWQRWSVGQRIFYKAFYIIGMAAFFALLYWLGPYLSAAVDAAFDQLWPTR